MKENINALDEINKGAMMGCISIDKIIDRVKDKKFKKVLEKQRDEYKRIVKDINKVYAKYNSTDSVHEVSGLEKIMTSMGIDMNLMMEESDSKIAELLLKGSNMGIIEGRRILNNKKLDKDVHEIAEDFTTIGEGAIEEIKKYL